MKNIDITNHFKFELINKDKFKFIYKLKNTKETFIVYLNDNDYTPKDKLTKKAKSKIKKTLDYLLYIFYLDLITERDQRSFKKSLKKKSKFFSF